MRYMIWILLLVILFAFNPYCVFAQGGSRENPVEPTETISDGRVAYLPMFYAVLDQDAQDRLGVELKIENETFATDLENGDIEVVAVFVFGICLDGSDCADNAGGFEIVDGEGFIALATYQLTCSICEDEWELTPEGENFVMLFGVRHVENMEFRYISYDTGEIWFDMFNWEEIQQYMAEEGTEIDPAFYEMLDGQSALGSDDKFSTRHEGTLDDPIPVGEPALSGENSFTILAVDVYSDLYGERSPTYCMLIEYHTDLRDESTNTAWVFLFDPITIDNEVNYLWGSWDPAYIEEDAGVDYEYDALIEVEAEGRVDWFGVNCFQMFEDVEIRAISFPVLRLGDNRMYNVVFSLADAPGILEY